MVGVRPAFAFQNLRDALRFGDVLIAKDGAPHPIGAHRRLAVFRDADDRPRTRRIFSIVTSPADSSFVRCTDRLLSDSPVRACRYLKSALAHKSSASSSASRAGSWTTRSMPTMSLNGSDKGGYLVQAGNVQPVIADAGDRQ